MLYGQSKKIQEQDGKNGKILKDLSRLYPKLEALKRTFKNESLFLLYKQKTSFNQKITAGAIFLKGDKTAYYWQVFHQ